MPLIEHLKRRASPAGSAALLTIGEYGLFRDECYYLACARHLA